LYRWKHNECYCDEDLLEIESMSKKPIGSKLLDYWCSHEEDMPDLAKLARTAFSILLFLSKEDH
jgi:hypothetical protein